MKYVLDEKLSQLETVIVTPTQILVDVHNLNVLVQKKYYLLVLSYMSKRHKKKFQPASAC